MNCDYKLEGLTCPNCAMKIEKRIGELTEFSEVSLNFTTQTLRVVPVDEKENYTAFIQEAVDKIEEGVHVYNKCKDHIHHNMDDAIHSHDVDHSKGHTVKVTTWLRLGVGALLFISGLAIDLSSEVALVIYLTGYIIVGGDVLLRAGKNILRGKVFDENFLMAVATIGAFAIGEYPEGVAVMLFYQLGEFFQDIAVNRSRASIESLMDIRPDTAWIKEGETLLSVQAEGVVIGQSIFVKPGERIPLDGTVIDGVSMLDTSALTGEAVPRKVEIDDKVLSGCVNQTGLIEIKVSQLYGESTVSKILDLVENATSKKAETEKFITNFARYYTPVVVYMALAIAIIPPIIINSATFSEWIHRALIFLVVSCPCALVISIPLGFFGGIGGASKHGILIKGSNYLEALYNVKQVVFDKTGTLTKGVFKVTSVKPIGLSSEALIELAAAVESGSNHPIAKSIMKAYGSEVAVDNLSDFEEIGGMGLSCIMDDQIVLVGNLKLMTMNAIDMTSINDGEAPDDIIGTVVYIAKDNVYLGSIVISDEIKEDSAKALIELRALGITNIVMLTGDHSSVASKIGAKLGLDKVHSELLPHEKVEILEKLLDKDPKNKTIFVGDGINDAPVLARADIGVAMGGIGSDAAIEAADVVLMTDEPSKLVDAIKIAKRTRAIVWQNIGFAMAVKGIVLILGAGGLATMWEAVFADVGVALIAIINAMRIIKKPLK